MELFLRNDNEEGSEESQWRDLRLLFEKREREETPQEKMVHVKMVMLIVCIIIVSIIVTSYIVSYICYKLQQRRDR